MPISADLKANIIAKAQKQVESCLDFRQPRLDDIKKSEDAYFGKTKPALTGRFNIPVPIVEGFVETLMSKIDDQIKIEFRKGRESTLKAARKVMAAWEKDSAPDRGAFNEADLDAKKLAIFSGFGALKLIPQSNPYEQKLIAIDYHDLVFEPYGGRDLDNHIFKGQLNIFKSKYELIKGVEAGIYDKSDTEKLINGTGESDKKTAQDQQNNKVNRFLAMGINPEQYGYVGDEVWNFTELITRYEDEDYYLLFERELGIAPICERVIDRFPEGFSPFVAWHTERNPVNFLCRAPVDGIRPVAEAMRILLNQNIDNIQKRNWDMVLYNARKILKPSQLEYRPHGLISVKLNDNESMNNAYAKMETPDTSTITINLLSWLNNFTGEKVGVTPGTQGNSDEDKVGIYQGNMQQAADRFGMINKFYTQAHIKIAKRYKANLAKFMPPRKFMVKFIGFKGLQEEELTRDEANQDLECNVVSSNAEAMNSEITQTKQEKAIDRIITNPILTPQFSPRFLAEEVLRIGAYPEDKIRVALDKEGGANEELLSEAAGAIEQIIDGEQPKINKGANMAYIKKLRDFARDEENLTDEEYAKILSFAADHLQIAEENELEQKRYEMRDQIKQQAMAQEPQGQTPANSNPMANNQPINEPATI